MSDSSFPKIFVIILNFNGLATLPNCLSSVFQSDYPNFEVIVVDNDSKDGSFEQARQQFSRVHFIKNSSNIGFAKGNNIGIRYALEKFADYVFVLNNDTVIEKNALSLLEKTAAANSKAGIISPLISDSNNETWFAGGVVNWKEMKNTHLHHAISKNAYSTEYVSGCAMFIKKDVFKKIGLFDERFFLYYEDADFSLRTRKASFDLLVEPAAKVKHLEQSISANSLKTYWLVLSGLLFFKIHASLSQKIWMFLYTFLRKIKNFYDLCFSKNTYASDVRKAYMDFKKIR
ncbi:MAG: glycosyl transferase family protein [uncultured bacterium]|nr:MAG: glycosyl transferase family protein [uncultured bacterium]